MTCQNFSFWSPKSRYRCNRAAIAFSHLQNELGKETEAVALGTPNEETQYALDHFQLSAPRSRVS